MIRILAFVPVAFLLTGCARPSSSVSSPSRSAPAGDVQKVVPRWQLPHATVTAGGTTAGLHQSTAVIDEEYEKVWEFYAERTGFAPNYKPDALEVASDCSAGPCIARAVTTANSPGVRSATFSHRSPEAGVVVTVRGPENAGHTEVQLTIIAH